MSELDWNKIKMQYLEGGTTYKQLAEQYSTTLPTISQHARRDGWQELKKLRYAETEKEMIRRAARQEADRTESVWAAADRMVERIYDLISDPAAGCTARDLRDLSSALRDVREVLGLRTSRDIREQEARIAKLEADVKRDSNEDKTIRVIMGDLESLAQ